MVLKKGTRRLFGWIAWITLIIGVSISIVTHIPLLVGTLPDALTRGHAMINLLGSILVITHQVFEFMARRRK